MSKWDQHTRGGKFIKNLPSSERNYEKHKKIQNEHSLSSETSKKLNELELDDDKKNYLHFLKYAAKVDSRSLKELSFTELGLDANLLRGLIGFSTPKRVQMDVFQILSVETNKHCVVCAPRKSGKTSASLLWVLNKLSHDDRKEYPKALMLCPTYELVEKAKKFAEQFSQYSTIKIYFTAKKTKFKKDEKIVADLVIATPGKAVNLPDLKNIRSLIFDDAHCMSDAVSHLKEVSEICKKISPRCSIIMCMLDSNPILDEFIDKYIPLHEKINIISNAKQISCKKKFITYNSKEERDNSIVALLENNKSSQGLAVIFGYSRDPLNELYSFLKFQNFSCEILTGGLTTCQRKVVLEGFNENKINVLITTYSFLNVIEAKNITMVINYEQKLNYEKLEICEETESLLSTGHDNLIVNYVEKKWEEFLIKQLQCQSGEQLFTNATIISANALSLSNC